jgi:hypothetical protein
MRLLHFSVVEYVNLGRKLGIGTRVAAKILRSRTQSASVSGTAATSAKVKAQPDLGQAEKRTIRIDPRTATRNATRGVVRGSRGFGQGFWKPFMRAVRALWHEVTGVFFAIFALFFAQSLWRVRADWYAGPQHHRFAAYLVFMLVFAYFSIAAFVSSRRSNH